jgi:tetratricopeptide (TPR) repeat protein
MSTRWAAALLAAVLFPAGLAHGQNRPPRTADSTPPGESVEAHLARGHEDLNNHRYGQAAREFRAALEINPRLTVRARFPLAVTLFALQERDEARQQFEAIHAETGDDPNVNYYLGRLDLSEGKTDSAIHNLMLASAQPPFPDTDYYLGYAYMKKRDLDRAEKWFKKAADLEPRDFRVQEHLGLLYQVMGRKAEAEKALALSAKLHRQDVAANEQALACGHSLDTQTLDEAREVCQKLFDPADLGKLVALGTLYGGHHDYADAVEPFRLAVGLDPDSYETQYNLGLTYFRLKRYTDARRPLEEAARLRPDVFDVTAPLGATLYALGNDAAAYPVLDHANRLRPQNADVARLLSQTAFNLATRARRKGDPAQARLYLLRAAEARPDDPEPKRRLADLDDAMGAHDEARREREQADRLSRH